MAATKQNLRKYYTAVRKRIPPADAERLSFGVAANAISILRLRGAELILAYHKLGSEADTAHLVEFIIGSGLGAALPYCRDDGSMGIGRIFNPRFDLQRGPQGAMEPIGRLKDNVTPAQLDAVVCPGVVFDESGARIGRGGGYYDRFLRTLKDGGAFKIGYAFDCQISKTPLPKEEYDVAMDAVVTEKRAFPAGCCPAIIAPAGEEIGGGR
ncbi:MAG: 5-formyltetrahydrofolate cyclo-ligase [Chitinispirillales bacterium]|jgi:5-formyltetrahydrofolate cyclo-ligase|nr:5-formyltetrahydrofolate cyclo-ligase [Chitinispirillales bacterium]